MNYDLHISIENGLVSIDFPDEYMDFAVRKALDFDKGNFEENMEIHAGLEVFWTEIAVEMKERFEDFKKIDYEKWWVHAKKYAKYVLAYLGETKPTIDAIKNMAVEIYSEDTCSTKRDRFFDYALMHARKRKWVGDGEAEMFEFFEEMARYLSKDPPWYFETVERKLAELRKSYQAVEKIAEGLHSRGILIQSYARLQMAKGTNIDSLRTKYDDRAHSLREQELFKMMEGRRAP